MAPNESFFADLQKVLLVEKVVAPEAMHAALEEQEKTRRSLLDILISSGKCNEKELVRILSRKYGYTAVNPAVFLIEEDLIALIPHDIALKYLALPITRFEKTLTVALANPTNLKAIDELHARTGLRIKAVIAQASLINKYIEKYYGEATAQTKQKDDNEAVMNDNMEDLVKMIEVEHEDDGIEAASELAKVARETPVIKLVNMIVLEGIKRHASDIFIEPWENFVRVRARVDGLLEEVIRPPKALSHALVSRIKIMSELDIAEHRVPQDGRFKVKVDRREVDMRVSILPTVHGEKVCMRILDTSSQSHDIAQLGFTEEEQTIIKDCAQKPHGMILVTGPTGSGKTTTLYSVLEYLHKPDVNITTVEDPVEYQIPGINQVNVREQVGLTFSAALRSILRQDPDIVLIGEIRDAETLDIAVKAALTGHLVLSTLHTNDAASSITRMANMGLEPFLIASTVLMISAQRLVRRVCPRCRTKYDLDDKIIEELGLDPKTERSFFRGKGCVQCRHSGYAGRTVITEILQMNQEIIKLVMAGETSEAIKKRGHEVGMSTLRESAIQKALLGETSLEEVFRVTSEDPGASRKRQAEEKAA